MDFHDLLNTGPRLFIATAESLRLLSGSCSYADLQYLTTLDVANNVPGADAGWGIGALGLGMGAIGDAAATAIGAGMNALAGGFGSVATGVSEMYGPAAASAFADTVVELGTAGTIGTMGTVFAGSFLAGYGCGLIIGDMIYGSDTGGGGTSVTPSPPVPTLSDLFAAEDAANKQAAQNIADALNGVNPYGPTGTMGPQ